MPQTAISHEQLSDAVQWLQNINAFCENLIEYVSTVPTDANADDYICIPLQIMESQRDGSLLWGCTVCMADVDFPAEVCAAAVAHVHQTAYRAFRAISDHPTLGMFRPGKTSLFFERGLGIAMSVGILQHVSGCMDTRHKTQLMYTAERISVLALTPVTV